MGFVSPVYLSIALVSCTDANVTLLCTNTAYYNYFAFSVSLHLCCQNVFSIFHVLQDSTYILQYLTQVTHTQFLEYFVSWSPCCLLTKNSGDDKQALPDSGLGLDQ